MKVSSIISRFSTNPFGISSTSYALQFAIWINCVRWNWAYRIVETTKWKRKNRNMKTRTHWILLSHSAACWAAHSRHRTVIVVVGFVLCFVVNKNTPAHSRIMRIQNEAPSWITRHTYLTTTELCETQMNEFIARLLASLFPSIALEQVFIYYYSFWAHRLEEQVIKLKHQQHHPNIKELQQKIIKFITFSAKRKKKQKQPSSAPFCKIRVLFAM